jgi:hypothetical protein
VSGAAIASAISSTSAVGNLAIISARCIVASSSSASAKAE